MASGIYKKGQGYWTRFVSVIAWLLLVLMGVVWLWNLLGAVRIGELETVYIQAGAAVILAALAGLLSVYLIYHHRRFGDFLIATEGEMKKVNWSSRREILGSTRLVILLTLFIALICWGLDSGFAWLFLRVGVLEG